MKHPQLTSLSVATLAMAVAAMPSLHAQKPIASDVQQGATKTKTTWKMPQTPWGTPDLHGIWSNATITPLQRPNGQDKAFISEEEAVALDREAATRYDIRSKDAKADLDAAYNQVWYDRGNILSNRQSSLIVDPPDGRLPALTAEGKKEAEIIAARRAGLPTGPEDLELAVR
jgi:hypothetical protein